MPELFTTMAGQARSGGDPAEAVRLAREILDEGRYQRDLPSRMESPSPRLDLGGLGWIVLAVALVGLAIWIAAWWRGRGGPQLVESRAHRAGTVEPPRFPASAIDEAERFAREGRYGEAIRKLLALTFEALRGREGVRLEPWLTGREVVREARVPDAVRSPLGSLVNAVELSLFANCEPSRADFERCAAEYRALVASAERSAA